MVQSPCSCDPFFARSQRRQIKQLGIGKQLLEFVLVRKWCPIRSPCRTPYEDCFLLAGNMLPRGGQRVFIHNVRYRFKQGIDQTVVAPNPEQSLVVKRDLGRCLGNQRT